MPLSKNNDSVGFSPKNLSFPKTFNYFQKENKLVAIALPLVDIAAFVTQIDVTRWMKKKNLEHLCHWLS